MIVTKGKKIQIEGKDLVIFYHMITFYIMVHEDKKMVNKLPKGQKELVKLA